LERIFTQVVAHQDQVSLAIRQLLQGGMLYWVADDLLQRFERSYAPGLILIHRIGKVVSHSTRKRVCAVEVDFHPLLWMSLGQRPRPNEETRHCVFLRIKGFHFALLAQRCFHRRGYA